MNLQDVRRQLLAERRERSFSQDAVADDAKVSQATISRLENLDVEMAEIEFETIRKIVEDGLDMTLTEFFWKIDARSQSRHLTAPPWANKSSGSTQGRANHGDPLPAPTLTVQEFARAIIDAAHADERTRGSAAGDRAARPDRRPRARKRR